MVKVNPRSFNGWYGLSYANYALDKSTAAVESGEKAVSISPNSVNALLILGISQRQAKQYEKAEKYLLKAKKLDNGKTPDINWNLALLYAHNFKRYKDAADELELYLKLTPQSPNAENVKKLIKKFRENPTASN
jgi:tetratricopeptide (TPR) repeat protein